MEAELNKLLIVGAVALFSATSASAMDVATFLAKGRALMARGAGAALTPEFREIQGEIQKSVIAARRQRLRALRANRRPPYCPGTGASLSSEEIQAAMLAVPAAQRRQVQVRDAIAAAFARKYPC
jgi:hypothetical protein